MCTNELAYCVCTCSGANKKEPDPDITTTPEDIKLAHMFETLGLSAEKADEVLKVLKSVRGYVLLLPHMSIYVFILFCLLIICFDFQGFDTNNISIDNVQQLQAKLSKFLDEDGVREINDQKRIYDGEQKVKMFLRDTVQIIKEWLSDPELAPFLDFEAEPVR